MKNKAEVIRKTGRFDNVDSAVIISRVTQCKSESFVLIFGQSCLHCNDDSRIYAVETSSFKNYCSFFLLKAPFVPSPLLTFSAIVFLGIPLFVLAFED